MVQVIAQFQFRPDAAERALTLCKELVGKSRADAGCLQYDLLCANADACKLTILETWTTLDLLQAHAQTEHFTQIVPLLADMSAVPPVVENYHAVL